MLNHFHTSFQDDVPFSAVLHLVIEVLNIHFSSKFDINHYKLLIETKVYVSFSQS